MSLAQVARELILAGVTGDALCDALERVERSMTPARSKAAERTARWRERKQQEAVSVTCDVRDACDVLKEPLSPIPPIQENNLPSQKKTPKGVFQKGSRLSPDWRPSEAGMADAVGRLGERLAAATALGAVLILTATLLSLQPELRESSTLSP